MSKVLILAICSNHKVRSAERAEWTSTWPVASLLPERHRDALLSGRRFVRWIVNGNAVSRDGKLLREIPYNADLVDGPDFGGSQTHGGYLPALQRYDGRFYRELGGTSERAALSFRIRHHLLIVSGLYGLLTPTERI